MNYIFNEQQKKLEINKIEIEEDEIILEAESVEGEGKHYIITGIAEIEGERYHDFQIEFELVQEPKENSVESIMETEWEWYDYLV